MWHQKGYDRASAASLQGWPTEGHWKEMMCDRMEDSDAARVIWRWRPRLVLDVYQVRCRLRSRNKACVVKQGKK